MDAVARSKRRKARLAGLSMIEVVIALSILAGGMLAMLTMQVEALKGGRTGRHVTEASRIAQDRLEQLNTLPWATVAVTGGWTAATTVTSGDSVDAGGQAVPQQFSVRNRIASFAGNPNLRSIDVQVTWREPGDPPAAPARRYAVSSIRFDDPGAP